MDRLQFFSPVRVSLGSAHPVQEIDSVAEATIFLRNWPVGRRGPVYLCAVNCCSAAMAGQMSAEEASKSFASFARITGLLRDGPRASAVHDRYLGAVQKNRPATESQ